MSKLITRNHQYDISLLVYHRVPFWDHLFMNDMSNSSILFELIMFAEDINLFTTIEYKLWVGVSKVDDWVNNELEKIYDWLTVNRLFFNLTKIKWMIFHLKQTDTCSLVPKLVINNIQIEKVDNISFLGVCLDSNLKSDGHIQFLATKLGKYTRILNKLKRYLPADKLQILYSSMFNSHLNYAILAWGFACSRLNKLQKRIMRTITCSRYNAYTSPLFKSLRLLTLHMLKVCALNFDHRHLHNEPPPCSYSFNIRTQGDTHSYDTGHLGQLHIERTWTEYADKRFRIYLPTLINDMPTELLATIATHSLQVFTKIAK